MILEQISDDNILEYLLTSDFHEEMKPEEYKFLLLKFRSLYKVLYGRQKMQYEQQKYENDKLKSETESQKENIQRLKTEIAELKNTIDLNLKPRKLTFKERWDGKIERY